MVTGAPLMLHKVKVLVTKYILVQMVRTQHFITLKNLTKQTNKQTKNNNNSM